MGNGFKCVCSLIHLYQSPKLEELALRAERAEGRVGAQ